MNTSIVAFLAIVACVNLAAAAPPAAACNVQAANSRKARLAVEAFCNDPAAKTTGAALLKPLAGVWIWTYAPALGVCYRHQIVLNATDIVVNDVKGMLKLGYVTVDGVVFRDQPPVWHCGSVSTDFLPIDSSPDHNILLQIECPTSGYEVSVHIVDFTKVTQANRDELTGKFGFDLTNMDSACAALPAPIA